MLVLSVCFTTLLLTMLRQVFSPNAAMYLCSSRSIGSINVLLFVMMVQNILRHVHPAPCKGYTPQNWLKYIANIH